MLPRFVPLPENIAPKGGLTFAFLEDVIEHNIHELFPGTEVRGAHLFRIIRDTDMVIQEDEADDLLETVDQRPEAAAPRRAVAARGRRDDAARACSTSWSRTSRSTRTSSSAPPTAWASATGGADPEAAPAAAEGPAVLAAPAVGRQRPRDDLRPDPLPGPPGPPPVRLVRVGRDVPARRDRRPARRRDQDDALPDRRRTRRWSTC